MLPLFACKHETKTSPEEAIKLTLTKEVAVEPLNSSQFFSSVKCIPLSTDEESLVGEIGKIMHRNGVIYVSDRFALYRFTEEGLFSGKISKRGNGPDEYAGISDFEIEPDGGVWILSRNDQTLGLYSQNGRLDRKIRINCWATKIYLIAPGKMCLYIGNEYDDNNHHQVRIIDLNAEQVLSNWLEIDLQRAKYLHVNTLSHFCAAKDGQGAYFYNLFDDYIYSLSGDGMEKRFRVDMAGRNIPSSFYEVEYKDVSYFFQALLSAGYPYGTVLFAEGDKVYLYAYYDGGKLHLAVISKETNKSIADFTTLTEDVLLSGYPIDLTENYIHVQGDNEIILPLSPPEIMEYGESRPEIRDQLRKTIQYKNEDQNAVLLTMKINKL
jgi:hypothetical protein